MHRCLGVSYARLLLGSTNLNDNLHKMKFTDTPNCECNEARETIPHFLMECSLYKESRTSMMNTIGRRWMENWKSGTLNVTTNILLGTNYSKMISKDDDTVFKKALFSFIHESGRTL